MPDEDVVTASLSRLAGFADRSGPHEGAGLLAVGRGEPPGAQLLLVHERAVEAVAVVGQHADPPVAPRVELGAPVAVEVGDDVAVVRAEVPPPDPVAVLCRVAGDPHAVEGRA